MKRIVCFLLLALCCQTAMLHAQDDLVTDVFNQQTDGQQRRRITSDSIQSRHKQIPRGLRTWTVDSRFGDMTWVEPDTVPFLFMNTGLTTGMYGDYNTTGNLGSPRINRIFADRQGGGHFMFTDPFDFFLTEPDDFHFTQTYSPITNLSYYTCGDRNNGEDHLLARFAVNAGRKFGAGFRLKYLYGRGYYQYQSTSLLDYTVYASYRADRYQAHFIASIDHQKQGENGGIVDDNYITHPESYAEDFAEDEIPTVLEQNWNRNDHQHLFFSHRYNIGFSRRVPLTEDERRAKQFAIDAEKEKEEARAREEAEERARREGRKFDEREYQRERQIQQSANRPIVDDVPDGQRRTVNSVAEADSIALTLTQQSVDTTWTKLEYVPVTSFIHTMQLHHYRRIYQAYQTPDDFYANEYYNIGRLTGDSIYDKTQHLELRNTFAVALLEGFNKWAKAGVKAFVSHDLRHFTLPDSLGGTTAWNEHAVSVGGALSKRLGNTLHYDLTAEFGVVGDDAGEVSINGTADVNIPFLRDTLRIEGSAFYHRSQPTFYMRHYQARHFWWDDDDMELTTHTRLDLRLHYKPFATTLRFALDRLGGTYYFLHTYTRTADLTHTGNTITPVYHGGAITLLTLQWRQQLQLGPLHWHHIATLQQSSEDEIVGVPSLNLYGNLFLRFRIAHVLQCDFGAEAVYYTKYYAPAYLPMIGQYGIAKVADAANADADYLQEKTGGHPYVNVYANFALKYARIFVMFGHVNADMGSRNYFLTPHYPQNSRVLRFGLSWNLFN